MARASLASRPLDLFYFIFLVSHASIAVLIDLQHLYPQHLVPAALKQIPQFYLELSQDPLIKGLRDIVGSPNEYTWFKATTIFFEGGFQVPITILAALILYSGSRTSWVLLVIYGASTATTVVPCIATVLVAPENITGLNELAGHATLTEWQRWFIIGNYTPFFLIPLFMAAECSLRLWKAVVVLDKEEEDREEVRGLSSKGRKAQ